MNARVKKAKPEEMGFVVNGDVEGVGNALAVNVIPTVGSMFAGKHIDNDGCSRAAGGTVGTGLARTDAGLAVVLTIGDETSGVHPSRVRDALGGVRASVVLGIDSLAELAAHLTQIVDMYGDVVEVDIPESVDEAEGAQ